MIGQRITFWKETEFKDTEIGRIPKEWGVTTIGNVARLIRSGPFGSELTLKDKKEAGYPVYGQEAVLQKDFTKIVMRISTEKFEKLKSMEIRPGDLLVTIRGTLGQAAIVPKEAERGIIHTNLAIIRLKENMIAAEFLEYLLNEYWPIRRQIESWASSTTLGALYTWMLGKIKIPLPPLEEQKKIAQILLSVDKKLEIERKEKEKLKRIKRALMDILLTGKVRVKTV